MRALFVLAFLLMLSFSYGRSTRKPKTACLGEVIKRLVRKDEDLIVVRKKRDKECFPILKLENPKVVVDFKRGITGSLNINATFVICVKSNRDLFHSLYYLYESSLWKNGTSARAKYFIVSKESNVKLMGKVLFNFRITKAKLIQRRVDSKASKIVKGKYKFFKHFRRFCKYTVIDNVIEIPKIDTILRTRSTRRVDTPTYYSYYFLIMSESLKIMNKALGVKTKLQYSTECLAKSNELRLFQVNTIEAFTPLMYSKFDITVPCVQDKYTWLVPKIHKTNHHQTMLFVFEWQTSILLLIVFILMVLKSWLASRRLRERNELQRVSTWMLIVAQLMVAVPTPLFPNRTSLRILFIFYMFYCFQISNWFQGYMTSVLVDSPNEPELETEFELYKSSIPLYVHKSEANVLKYQLGKTYDEIKDKLTISTVFEYRNIIEFCAERGCAFLINENLVLFGNLGQIQSKFYLLKYGDRGFTNEYLALPRGHYLFEKVNNMLKVINECGIHQKIARNMKNQKPPTNVDPESNIYLNLVHLKEVFVLFAVGMSIATIALLAELIYYYRFDTRRIIVV